MAYQRSADSENRLSGYSAHTNGRYGGIEVNGKQDLAHESFILREHVNQNESGFCKTARKPSDVVVAACLLILKYHLKDGFVLGSDGTQSDFADAVELASRVTRRKIKIPVSIRVDERRAA